MSKFKLINKKEFEKLINRYKAIQSDFLNQFNVDDIFSNSKIYEIIIANELGHNLIPGHSGSKDAISDMGEVFEYKHYKKSSSNHTWTFNDFTDTTIEELKRCNFVIFAHIDDSIFPENFNWYYKVPGIDVSNFLFAATKRITNKRKMINISRNSIEDIMGYSINSIYANNSGKYSRWLNDIYTIEKDIEKCTNVNHILTSNKIWEILVAIELNHNVNSEQGGRKGAHDAFDKDGNQFEYKVSKNYSWNFQDISENVLNKYMHDTSIILAVVDKTNIKVEAIYSAEPRKIVRRLKEKLSEKADRFKSKGLEIRRLQVSLSKGDLKKVEAIQIY